MGFAKAHGLRTHDALLFERLPDRFTPQSAGGFRDDELRRGWVTLRVSLHRAQPGA